MPQCASLWPRSGRCRDMQHEYRMEEVAKYSATPGKWLLSELTKGILHWAERGAP